MCECQSSWWERWQQRPRQRGTPELRWTCSRWSWWSQWWWRWWCLGELRWLWRWPWWSAWWCRWSVSLMIMKSERTWLTGLWGTFATILIKIIWWHFYPRLSQQRVSTRRAGLWGTPRTSSLGTLPHCSFATFRYLTFEIYLKLRYIPTYSHSHTNLTADFEQHLSGEQQHHRLPRPRRHHGHLHAEHVIQSGTNSCSGIHKISLEILSECCQTNDKKVTIAKDHWTVKSLLTFSFFRLHLICLFLHLVGLLQDRQLSKAREEIKATKGRSSRKYVVQQRNKAAVALANIEQGWFQSKLMSSHCLSILPKIFHLAFHIHIA